MTQIEAVQLWLSGAEDAWDTCQKLVTAKKLNHGLFFGQLYLEKLLKGLTYHLKDDHPLPVHNLVLLCDRAGIKLSLSQKSELEEITTQTLS